MIKKITAFAVMALLCFCFAAFGQSGVAVDVTAKGIKVGQRVPDVVLSGLHNYRDKQGKAVSSARLSDFRGKLLILDFWATWCSPCVAMIPKMDSLQMLFGDKVQFLSVSYQKDSEVLPFIENLEKRAGKHYGLPMLNGDQVLRGMFPHVYLPHYVWIDAQGVVRAMTEFKDVNAATIERMLSGGVELVQKRDQKISFDNKRPLLINGNGGDGSTMRYHAVFTGYIQGLQSSLNRTSPGAKGPRKITAKNCSMLQLMRFAHEDDKRRLGWNRTVVETADAAALRSSAMGAAYEEWLAKNGFCYELWLPKEMGISMYDYMKEDLRRVFPAYRAAIEIRTVKCLVLKRTSMVDKLTSKGGQAIFDIRGDGARLRNASLMGLVMRLDNFYMQHSTYPLVDGTGIKGRVDLDIQANLSDLGTVNIALARYDVSFVLEDHPIEMLVVRDVDGLARGGDRGQ